MKSPMRLSILSKHHPAPTPYIYVAQGGESDVKREGIVCHLRHKGRKVVAKDEAKPDTFSYTRKGDL